MVRQRASSHALPAHPPGIREIRSRGAAAREMEARLAAGDIPVGLSAEEYARRVPKPFDGLGDQTKDVYEKFFRYFQDWCSGRGIGLDVVEADHVITYLEAARERKPPDESVSVSWLRSSVAAIQKGIAFYVVRPEVADPEAAIPEVDWAEVRLWVDREQSLKPDDQAPAAALTWSLIQHVIDVAWLPLAGERPEKTARRASLDVALILFMWGCLLRREEAAAARWGHIKIEQQPGHVYGVLQIPRGKTDRYGRGDVGYIHIHTVAALYDMAKACGRDITKLNEPIFGIGDRQISNRIKAACGRAGLRGEWSGHSPRRGALHDLLTHGFSLLEAMHAGRWVRPEMVSRYARGLTVRDGAMARLQSEDGYDMGIAPVVIRPQHGRSSS